MVGNIMISEKENTFTGLQLFNLNLGDKMVVMCYNRNLWGIKQWCLISILVALSSRQSCQNYKLSVLQSIHVIIYTCI